MTTPYAQTHIADDKTDAEHIARDHGKSAATWVDIDSPETALRILRMSRDEIPTSLYEAFRPPGLSGEYSGEYSEQDLFREIGHNPENREVWPNPDDLEIVEHENELATIYNDTVSEAFYTAIDTNAYNYLKDWLG